MRAARHYDDLANWAPAFAGVVPQRHPTHGTFKPCLSAKAGAQTGLPPLRESKERVLLGVESTPSPHTSPQRKLGYPAWVATPA